MQKVFKDQHAATCLLGHAQHQRVSIRKSMRLVHIDGGKKAVYRWLGNAECREELYLTAGCSSVEMQLPCRRNKIFLKEKPPYDAL